MPAAPVGRQVGLYMDTRREVHAGDVIRTTGTGRCYLVDHVRPQTRGVYAGLRLHLRVTVIDPVDVPADSVIHPITWYHRGKKR